MTKYTIRAENPVSGCEYLIRDCGKFESVIKAIAVMIEVQRNMPSVVLSVWGKAKGKGRLPFKVT